MRERTIGFVWGYLFGIDEQSEAAKRIGLMQRFSLAFNSYPDSGPGLYETAFDAELILGVFGVLLPLFSYDVLKVVDDLGASHSDLATACRIDPEDRQQESFASATLAQGGSATCYIEYAAYNRCGGPDPYHDAYVYGFYCKAIERQPVQDALFSFCSENGVILSDVISGRPIPVRAPWYRRILALMK